jgi:hypothetical protein
MWQERTEEPIHVNWTAILSLTGSIVCSLAIWAALFRAVQYLVK